MIEFDEGLNIYHNIGHAVVQLGQVDGGHVDVNLCVCRQSGLVAQSEDARMHLKLVAATDCLLHLNNGLQVQGCCNAVQCTLVLWLQCRGDPVQSCNLQARDRTSVTAVGAVQHITSVLRAACGCTAVHASGVNKSLELQTQRQGVSMRCIHLRL